MIPKIIHYCWFGPNEKPKSVNKYIEGWKEKLPGYEIKAWNESNFDIECCEYVKQAYEANKFAFVSDVSRLTALYEYGGVYFDTDVEVLKSIDILMNRYESDVILGFEEKEWVCTSTLIANKKSKLIRDFLNSYQNRKFIKETGTFDMKTNVEVLTEMLTAVGLKMDGTLQKLEWKGESITILPQFYLSPYDYINCVDKSTEESFTRHNFDISWGKRTEWIKKFVKSLVSKILGPEFLPKLRRVLSSE